jgi:hypothetical protein
MQESLAEVRSAGSSSSSSSSGGGGGRPPALLNSTGGGGLPLDKERRLHSTHVTVLKLFYEQDRKEREDLLKQERDLRENADAQLQKANKETAWLRSEHKRIWEGTKATLLQQEESTMAQLVTAVATTTTLLKQLESAKARQGLNVTKAMGI